MSEFLAEISQLATMAFAISTMLAMGMGLTVREVVAPLRNVRLLLAALLVNFLIVPAAAWLLAALLGLAPDLRIGLLLIACAAGAPMVPKLAQIARGHAATAVALVTLLIVATVVVAPQGQPELLWVSLVAGALDTSHRGQLLLPLAIGIFMRERWEEEAAEYRPTVATLSNVALAVLFLTSVGANLPDLLNLVGTGGILAVVGLIVVALVAGYALGIPAGVERRVLALGAGQRNTAAAFVIATGNFADRPTVFLLIGLAALLMMVILFPLAGEWSKRPSTLAAPVEQEATPETTPGAAR
jgi:BASS family bile acid:Na+ symporter